MWHYLETRGAWLKAGPQPALFLSHSGHRLSRHGFWLILTAYAKAAGINEHVSPHMLRHSFATQALRAGTSLREVQRLLGHANDSTTRAYTHLPDASPLERSELMQHRAG